MTPIARHRPVGFLAASLLLATACAPEKFPAAPAIDAARNKGGEETQQIPRQYVVIYKDGATGPSPTSVDQAGASLRGQLQYVNGGVYDNVEDPAALAADPNVESVSENMWFTLQQAPAYQTDATFWRRGWQWNMQQIRAHQVPGTVRGQGVKVCIIDSGIDELHQDLAGKVAAAQSFVTTVNGFTVNSPIAQLDSNGHGSHVAGTVTSNGIGVASVAPGAELLNARVFPATGGTSLAAIWEGMSWCTQNGADVINMSLGGIRPRPLVGSDIAAKASYTQRVQAAREAGVVVVVSAGNDNALLTPDTDPLTGSTRETWPSQIPGVISVAASSPVGALASFPFSTPAPNAGYDGVSSYTNMGPDVTVWAPGGSNVVNRIQSQITSVCSGVLQCSPSRTLYRSISGTSMAAPHVAGVAALITGRTSAGRTLARTIAVEQCLINTGDLLTFTKAAVRRNAGVTTPTLTVTSTQRRINALSAATGACAGI